MSRYKYLFNKNGIINFKNILREYDITSLNKWSKKISTNVKSKKNKPYLFYIDNISNYYYEISKFEKERIYSIINTIEPNSRLIKDVYYCPNASDVYEDLDLSTFTEPGKIHTYSNIFPDFNNHSKTAIVSPFDFSIKYGIPEGNFHISYRWKKMNIKKNDVLVYNSFVPLIFPQQGIIPIFSFTYAAGVIVEEEENPRQVFWG